MQRLPLLAALAAVFALGALSVVGAVAANPPRLISNPPAQVGGRWIGVADADRAPVVRARLGSRSQRVSVRRLQRGRYQLRTVFPFSGRWALWTGRRRLGIVLVRPTPLRLTNAVDVAVERSGTLLVADLSNRVFRVSENRLTLAAGNGRRGRIGDGAAATRAAIGFPVEIAPHPGGGFGIVHDERYVRHVDAGGIIRTTAELAQPTALAYDSAGNVYVSELLGGVVRIAAAGGARTVYGGFNRPHGLAVAADGTVYVADTFNNRIARISPDGDVTTLADALDQPNDVALGPDGSVYASVFGADAIMRIARDGAVARVADADGSSSVAVAGDGTVYVTERGRAAVRRIGAVTLVALRPARAHVAWSGIVRSPRRPSSVIARNGVTTIEVAVRALGRSRFRLRAVFPFSGRWQLRAGRRTLGTVAVAPAPPLRSLLPGAQAFRLCGGTRTPYPQYALSRDAETGALWASCRSQARLHRIDPRSGETRAILRLEAAPYSIAAGLGAVWSADRGPELTRIEPRTGRGASVFSGHEFAYVWTARGSVWAGETVDRYLVRHDPAARRSTPIPVGDGPSALVEEGGRIWILNHRDGTLMRVDPATNTATTLARLPGDAPERMVYADGSLWVTGRGTDLLRVDPATGAVQAAIELGAGGIDVHAAAHSIWVAAPTDEDDRTGTPVLERLLRVDPEANAVTETVLPTGRIVVNGLGSTGDALWIADTEGGRLYRVGR